MRGFSIVFVLAGAAALTASGAATAGEPSARVSYDDLRLTTAEGQAELHKRIGKAAWRVCMFDESGDLRPSDEHAACYRSTQRTVEVQVAQIIAERRLAADAPDGEVGG